MITCINEAKIQGSNSGQVIMKYKKTRFIYDFQTTFDTIVQTIKDRFLKFGKPAQYIYQTLKNCAWFYEIQACTVNVWKF